MNLKQIAKKILYGKKYSSETYVAYLRKIGVRIGEDCIIYSPTKTFIDEQYPWMITIGNHVRITEGVKILTHDYSWSVFKAMYGCVLGVSGCVAIGNNVFIGMNTIITNGIHIGDNVIIGAASVVTNDCEANSVYAGVPAKKIMSIEQFIEKREKKQVAEAKILARNYYKTYGKKPNKEVFHEYFMLFSDASAIQNNKLFLDKIKLCNNEEQSIEYINAHRAVFKDFNDFMRYCFEDEKK